MVALRAGRLRQARNSRHVELPRLAPRRCLRPAGAAPVRAQLEQMTQRVDQMEQTRAPTRPPQSSSESAQREPSHLAR